MKSISEARTRVVVSSPIPNPSALKSAECFRQVAESLRGVDDFIVPLVVNASFAMELFLKSLNISMLAFGVDNVPMVEKSWAKVKVNQTGHSLSVLFHAINDETKNEIEKYNLCHNYFKTNDELISLLSEYDGLFVKWRYAFEGGIEVLDVDRLLNLLKILSKVIHQLPKNFYYLG